MLVKRFTMVNAENFEGAVEISKSDPFLLVTGTIRVSQMMEIK